MFGKLLKYEFKSIGKWYLALYGIAFVLSIALGLMLRQWSLTSESVGAFTGTILGLFSTSFVIILTTLFISTLIIIIKRFYDNILGRQGYLTMTLPVTTHQILLSKITASTIWYCLAVFTASFSLVLFLLFVTGEVGTFLMIMGYILQEISDVLREIGGTIFLGIIWALVGVIGFIIQLYLAMSIGHLSQKNRVLRSFLAYFGVWFVLSLIGSNPMINPFLAISLTSSNVESIPSINTALMINITYQVIISVASYFGIHYIIKNKLNIQ